MIFWILGAAIVGSTIAAVFLIWRTWIVPWRRVEQLINEVGRGKQPRTFLIEGGKEAQRVSVGLERILRRQRELDHEIGQRESGQRAILSAMHDGLLVVDGQRRLALVNRAFCDLFEIGED